MAYLNYTRDEAAALFAFYGNKCLVCGTNNGLTIDHIVPVSLKGKDVLQNIQPLCQCTIRTGV